MNRDTAREIVRQYVCDHLDPSDKVDFGLDDVYVVWFGYVLGNWKALVSTNLPDGMYYEVTHSEDKSITYLTAYKRFDSKEIPS